MKIVFFGTSGVGLPILEALTETHEVAHVVTIPASKVGRKQEIQATPIAQFADDHKMGVSKPEKVKNNPEFIEFLRSLNADIFVVVSYGKILPVELLDIPPLKTVNVHFSLLPKYRGPAPIQFALLNGEQTTGTTIFILDELVDHGPVLAMQELEIDPDDTFATLAPKLSEVSAQLLIDVLPKYESGEIIPQEQNHEAATKTSMIKKEDGKVSWETHTAQEIYNRFRAYTPWPGIWTEYDGQVLKILSCEPIDQHPESANLENNTHEIRSLIECANNTFLKLNEVQLAGKNKMTMKDFLNGHPNFAIARSEQ
jgi:methionyl-tRNA formyltransferase